MELLVLGNSKAIAKLQDDVSILWTITIKAQHITNLA